MSFSGPTNLALAQVLRYQQFSQISRNQAKLVSVPESVPGMSMFCASFVDEDHTDGKGIAHLIFDPDCG